MKRWTLRILICLIFLTGGAITTVAVAWRCSGLIQVDEFVAFRGDDTTFQFFVRDHDAALLVTGWERQGGAQLIITPFPPEEADPAINPEIPTRKAPDWSLAEDAGAHLKLYDRHFVEQARGWPLLSMIAGATLQEDQTSRTNLIQSSGVALTEHDFHMAYLAWRSLPLSPLWPGFAINTLFYAAIWFGVFFGFTSAKRLIRVKRGRCPRCGYDLRGGVMSDKRSAMSGETADGVDPLSTQHSAPSTSPGCPECGWGRDDEVIPEGEGM